MNAAGAFSFGITTVLSVTDSFNRRSNKKGLGSQTSYWNNLCR